MNLSRRDRLVVYFSHMFAIRKGLESLSGMHDLSLDDGDEDLAAEYDALTEDFAVLTERAYDLASRARMRAAMLDTGRKAPRLIGQR